jgi:hypothetical protein
LVDMFFLYVLGRVVKAGSGLAFGKLLYQDIRVSR